MAMRMASVLALDIGGANIKWAAGDGEAGSVAFALWREPEALSGRLEALLDALLAERARGFEALLVTMTAELCDCFATKAAGVRHVLDATERAARGRAIHVWSTTADFITPEAAVARPVVVAAANWHALATSLAKRLGPASGVLVDVGSTTTDLIPLAHGACAAKGVTDTQRLATGELVYLGVERTPLMAVASQVTWRGERVGVMAEHFATMGDAMLLIGETRERPDDTGTADGRPMTRPFAAARVLRMVGSDLDTHGYEAAVALAHCFVEAARERLAAALAEVLYAGGQRREAIEAAIVSGSGESLAEDVAGRVLRETGAAVRRLSDIIGPQASTAACAHALVQLWNQRCTTTTTTAATPNSAGPNITKRGDHPSTS